MSNTSEVAEISPLESNELAPAVLNLIEMALAEDIGEGDVTSMYFVPEDAVSTAYILVKEDGVLAGLKVAQEVFRQVDSDMQLSELVSDGAAVIAGTRVLRVTGKARSLLTAERTALNFMQRLSGVASKTAGFVSLIDHTEAKLLDTRKTTPGWRLLEKQAVLAGGGTNHRIGLYDRAMVKDNHLVAQHDLDALQQAITSLKKDKPHVEVELEADTLEQVADFLKLEGVDYILLDNMSNAMLRQAVQMRGDSEIVLEASGGVNIDTIGAIAETGVDFISVGALTHSAVALDISLEFAEE